MKKIGAILLILALGITLAGCKIIKPQPLDGPGMINVNAIYSITYSVLGGMADEHYVLEYNSEEQKLKIEEKDGEYQNFLLSEYIIPESYISELERISDEHDMYNWTDLKKSDEEEPDAPGIYLDIEYYTGVRISVDANSILPEGGEKGIQDIIATLEAARHDDNTQIIPNNSVSVSDLTEKGYTLREDEEGLVKVWSLDEDYVILYDGRTTEVTIEGWHEFTEVRAYDIDSDGKCEFVFSGNIGRGTGYWQGILVIVREQEGVISTLTAEDITKYVSEKVLLEHNKEAGELTVLCDGNVLGTIDVSKLYDEPITLSEAIIGDIVYIGYEPIGECNIDIPIGYYYEEVLYPLYEPIVTLKMKANIGQDFSFEYGEITLSRGTE